jgi:hypothetical protein
VRFHRYFFTHATILQVYVFELKNSFFDSSFAPPLVSAQAICSHSGAREPDLRL